MNSREYSSPLIFNFLHMYCTYIFYPIVHNYDPEYRFKRRRTFVRADSTALPTYRAKTPRTGAGAARGALTTELLIDKSASALDDAENKYKEGLVTTIFLGCVPLI